MKNGNGGGLAVYIIYDCQACQAISEVSKLNITLDKVWFEQDMAMYGGGVYMYVSLPCTALAEYVHNKIYINVSFSKVLWHYNEAKIAGAAVYIENVQKHGKSTTVDFVDVAIYFSGKNIYLKRYRGQS